MRHVDTMSNVARLKGSTLRLSARAVYLVLLAHTDDNGLCFPSVPTIAAVVGLTPANVRRNLAVLVDDGLIAVERGGGRGHTNLYRLTVEVVPIPRGGARVSDGETRAETTRNPRGGDAKPARHRATNGFERNTERGTLSRDERLRLLAVAGEDERLARVARRAAAELAADDAAARAPRTPVVVMAAGSPAMRARARGRIR